MSAAERARPGREREEPLVGIFIGGQGRRMGGVAKGLLPAPDGTQSLVARLVREIASALPKARVVLVGRHAAYAALPFEQLEDAPSLDGPSGGLVSLLERALARGTCALALASDMPWLTSELLLRVALSHPHAAAVAPRRSRWECLVARYEPARVLPLLRERSARGAASLQGLFAELGSAAVEIELSPAEAAALNDWDTPEDVRQQRPPSLGRGERGTHASPFPLR